MPDQNKASKRVKKAPGVLQEIDEDDECPICKNLLVRPVSTRSCSHTFCQDCFSFWADISVSQMALVSIDETLFSTSFNEEARCPMCRTATVASLDRLRDGELQAKYPIAYAARKQAPTGIEDEDGNFIEQITLYIGNEHKLLRVDTPESKNTHEWRFFVEPSRKDIIEEVHVFLHPTFKPNQIIQSSEASIRRIGWGTFTVYCNLILKGGWSWCSSDAEDTPDGAPKGKLPLEWMLDFDGRGSKGRIRLKVKKEKNGQEIDDEIQSERTRRLWMTQRERDPDYVPPEEETC